MPRPKKTQNSESSEKTITAIGVERRGGYYVSFKLTIQGDKVVKREETEPDLKVSACDRTYADFISLFVEGDL